MVAQPSQGNSVLGRNLSHILNRRIPPSHLYSKQRTSCYSARSPSEATPLMLPGQIQKKQSRMDAKSCSETDCDSGCGGKTCSKRHPKNARSGHGQQIKLSKPEGVFQPVEYQRNTH